MLKAAGETGTLWMTEVCNAVVKDGKVPEDWSRSWMVNVYKGKGDALTCGSYRDIKLLEHAMKVLEKIEGRLRKIVKTDSMQFGFMSGRSSCRRDTWRRIKNWGWLLLIWRKHLTGCLGRWFGGR